LAIIVITQVLCMILKLCFKPDSIEISPDASMTIFPTLIILVFVLIFVYATVGYLYISAVLISITMLGL